MTSSSTERGQCVDRGSVFPTCLPSAHFLLSDAIPDPCLENATTHSWLGLSSSIGHHGISSPDTPTGQLDLDNAFLKLSSQAILSPLDS